MGSENLSVQKNEWMIYWLMVVADFCKFFGGFYNIQDETKRLNRVVNYHDRDSIVEFLAWNKGIYLMRGVFGVQERTEMLGMISDLIMSAPEDKVDTLRLTEWVLVKSKQVIIL